MKSVYLLAIMFLLIADLIENMSLAGTDLHYMRIGRLWIIAEYDGAEGMGGQYAWPGGYSRFSVSQLRAMWGANVRKTGTIAGCSNWTGPNGTVYDFWTSGMYRYYDYDYLPYWKDQTHQTALYPVNQILYQRWAPPQITVNGEDISPPAGDESGFPDLLVETQIDPELITEMAIKSVWRYSMGVEYERMLYAYSNPNHQDYALYDITLTNNGKLYGLPKDPPDLWPNPDWPQIMDNQTVEDFWWAQTMNPYNSASGRAYSISPGNDEWGEFIAPFADQPDRHFFLFYDGDKSDPAVKDFGDPSIDERWIELLSPAWLCVGTLYADKSSTNKVDDPTQPRSTTIKHERDYDLGKVVQTMQDQYDSLFQDGVKWPLNTPHPEINPAISIPSGYTCFGPYDLGFGQSIDIIYVIAAGGINHELCKEYGKKAWDADYSLPIMEEIETVFKTGRDSVLKTLQAARWNVSPDQKDGRRKFDVPDAPRPPAEFHLKSEISKIVLEWSDEAENEPDFDSGVNDFAGYRLFRATGSSDSSYYLIWEGNAHMYEDTEVSTEEQYFYYLTAYDNGSQNWEDPGVSLESGRFWCWTGWHPVGVTPNATAINYEANLGIPNSYTLYQNYPNPFNPSTKIKFELPKPESVKIEVYDIIGQKIQTLLNKPMQAGYHEVEFKRQNLPSGVYLYRIETGEWTNVKKMILMK